MSDREKVIKAVECRKNAHKRCGNPCERTGNCKYAAWIRSPDGEPYYPCYCDTEKLCTDILLLLREQEAVEPTRKVNENIDKAPTIGGWISVKERLPEKYGHYLVIRDNGFMSVDTWTRHSHWGKAVCKITHWMPLPEPPKE